MLDEGLRKLTAKNNNKQTTSENVLAWAKRVKVQQAQTDILNDITESHKFDKIKMDKKLKSTRDRHTTNTMSQRWLCRYCGGSHVPSIWENMCWMWEDGPFQEGAQEQGGLCGA